MKTIFQFFDCEFGYSSCIIRNSCYLRYCDASNIKLVRSFPCHLRKKIDIVENVVLNNSVHDIITITKKEAMVSVK